MKHKGNCYDEEGHLLYAVGTGTIMRMPTIDAVPVRHGEWCGEADGYADGERPMVWTDSDYELGARNQYDADVLALETVSSAQPGITLESAIDYLHSIGWMQEHDRTLTESAQPEIIRCKDCKFFVSDMEWCEADDEHPASPDAFCSWAERRDG